MYKLPKINMVFLVFSYFLRSLQTAMAVFSTKFHVFPSKLYLQLLWCNSWLHRQIFLMKIVDFPDLSARRHLNSLWNTCVVCSFHWKFQMNKRFCCVAHNFPLPNYLLRHNSLFSLLCDSFAVHINYTEQLCWSTSSSSSFCFWVPFKIYCNSHTKKKSLLTHQPKWYRIWREQH